MTRKLSAGSPGTFSRSEEHTSELQSRRELVCRLLPEKKNEVTTMHAALGRPEELVHLEMARLKAARADRGLTAGGPAAGQVGSANTGGARGADSGEG